ncbi:hypothetical protein CEE97_10995, partial [Lactobacillus crispatus]
GAPGPDFTGWNGRGRGAEFGCPAGAGRAAIHSPQASASGWHTSVRNIPGNRLRRSSAVYFVSQLAGYTNHHLGLSRAMFRPGLKGVAAGPSGIVQSSIGRTFAALNATNEAILYAKSPEELYGKVCEAAFSSGSFLA